MTMLSSFNPIKEIQKSQDFCHFDHESSREISFDELSPLPNQFMYTVNCETAEIERIKGDPWSTFKRDQLSSIDEMYEMIKPEEVEKFLAETKCNFNFIMTDPKRTIPKRNVFSSVFEMKVGFGYQPFLRQTFTLRSDINGIFTHTGGIYTALPGRPKSLLNTYEIFGADAIYFKSDYLRHFDHILSRRELEVLKLISEGKKSSEIGEQLYISRYTVETHRKHMVRKLEASNTAHLINISKDLGLI